MIRIKSSVSKFLLTLTRVNLKEPLWLPMLVPFSQLNVRLAQLTLQRTTVLTYGSRTDSTLATTLTLDIGMRWLVFF